MSVLFENELRRLFRLPGKRIEFEVAWIHRSAFSMEEVNSSGLRPAMTSQHVCLAVSGPVIEEPEAVHTVSNPRMCK
jgi:hypothetical protein